MPCMAGGKPWRRSDCLFLASKGLWLLMVTVFVVINYCRNTKNTDSMYPEILLIEDNLKDAELTMRSFKKNNITNNVLHLKDGAEALEFLFGTGQFKERDLNKKPNVILLDLQMPKVDGI